MLRGSLTGYVDMAQVTLYVFWIFFAGLIYYLRREDRREGYPLVSQVPGQTELVVSNGYPETPPPKVFRLYHGGVALSPSTQVPRQPEGAVPAALFPGAPLEPTGNPLIDGIGPASYCFREDEPDLTIDGLVKYKPMRLAPEYRVDPHHFQPRGMRVAAADGIEVGTVFDVWIDEIAHEIVYLEVELDAALALPRLLIPERFVRYRPRRNQVSVRALVAAQLVHAPRPISPDQTTRAEEDKILGYFGGGALYGTPARLGPLL